MHILIADDEYFTRKALIKSVMNWNPDTAIFEAEDGQEALELLAAKPIDVVFSDIRMPRVDGMQLAAIIHSHYPDIFNVIISGYDDFQYTQKAIMHKVEHYLLKPVKKSDIYAVLDKISAELEADQAKAQDDLLAAILCEGADPQALQLCCEPGSVFVAAVLDGDNVQLVGSLLREYFHKWEIHCRTIRDKKHPHISIAVLQGNAGSAHKLLDVRGIWERLAGDYQEEGGGSIVIGIGELYSEPGQLVESYKEAKNALLYKLLSERGGVYTHEDTKANKQFTLPMLDGILLPLYNTMMNNKPGDAAALVRQLFGGIAGSKQLSAYTLQDVCSKLTTTLNSVIEFINNRSEVFEPYMDQPDLYRFASLKQISDYFESRISAIAAKLEQCSTRDDMIQKIMDYIDRNYAQNIVLDELAKNVYYTDSSYLSRLFKKKSGVSFTQYLISVRMEKAKKLLESDPDLTVSQVASHVGFNDYSHFIQTYKKHFGETPGVNKKK